ncbi:MAG: MotA/TolQ/ExbB proton channel family protein [Ferruginibacter sp.]|nr:MotA/TolQ/ExbB proton channel family protein [Bacteroidota bacterium]MBX2920106.1 MotA/TolQ/ExbB proton channel family protein [Ferruginibacter sp.]
MFNILLQIDSTAVVNSSSGKESLFSLLVKGGVLMIPLAIFMAMAIFFFIERLIAIRKASRIDDNFMNIIRDNIISGNVSAARSLAKNTPNPVAKMIDKGIQRIGKPIDAIERNMDNIGKLEIYKMEKNLPVLSVIARIAPLFGFVGTIIGLVMLLRDFAAAANPSITDIADAMYVKMITSATGLIIGILSYLGYSYLNTQIDKTVHKMETSKADFIDILQEPTK